MHLPTILGLWLHEVYILVTEPDKHIKARKRSRHLQNVISATKEPYKVLKQRTLGAISFRYIGAISYLLRGWNLSLGLKDKKEPDIRQFGRSGGAEMHLTQVE